MIEARTFVPELDSARKILLNSKAECKGHFRFHDTIYRNKITGASLNEEFLRLRQVPENIWSDKAVILAVKRTVLRDVGKVSNIPTKIQFDTVEEAREYYDAKLSDTYVEDFGFWREGWQYVLPNGDVVDLEIVDSKFPTIELKSVTDSGISQLLGAFQIAKTQIIIGPSVVAIRKLVVAH